MNELRTPVSEPELREQATIRLQEAGLSCSPTRVSALQRLPSDHLGAHRGRHLLASVPDVGLGIGLVFHAWDIFRPPVSEQQIQREMKRMR